MTTSTLEPAISVSQLSKSYGSFPVIRNLDLQVSRGAIHGLVGLNGSGKTTTLECVLGLQDYDSGEVSVLGKQPAEIYRNQGKVVAIFDTPSLNPNLTVRQCLQHALLMCEKPGRSIDEVASLLGIESFRQFKIKNLSLGNKRRASIAQALLANPQLVLLDEPFNGLDAGGVDDVLSLIATLNREQGTTFLLSSHQLPYLEQVCSHIAILHNGSIAVSEAKESLLQESGTQLLLRTASAEQAQALIATHTEIKALSTDTAGCLQLQSDSMDAASINKFLVSNDIPVSELVQQRDSLESLFRQITSEPAP